MTTALVEPLGLAHCIFDGVRRCGFQARGFTSHFHQLLSDVHSFANHGVFVVPFHSDSSFLYGFITSLLPAPHQSWSTRSDLVDGGLMQSSQPTPLLGLSVRLNQLFDSCSLLSPLCHSVADLIYRQPLCLTNHS